MLDLLELYTHHRGSTSVGPDSPLDLFLTIRIPLNQEADSQRLPRFTYWKRSRSGSNGIRTSNGSKDSKDTPKDTNLPNPMTPTAAHAVKGKMGERGRDGTVRFILHPEQAREERTTVAEYFKVEMEEYEVDE
jgi:CTD kinase subunit beta